MRKRNKIQQVTYTHHLYYLLIIIFLLSLSVVSFAQWSDDPAVNTPICTSPADQSQPFILHYDAGYSIIVWQDERNGDVDIYAQKVDDDGIVQWAQNGIPIIQMNGDQIDFAAVSDGQGGVIVVWCDKRNGYQGDVYGQRVDSDGNLLWATDGKALGKAPHYQGKPAIAATGDGSTFVLSWLDRRNDENADEIYCQKIDRDGNLLWPNDVEIAPTDTLPSSPRIIGDPSGGAYVAWYEQTQIDTTLLYGGTGVYLQRLHADGTSAWTPQRMDLITYPEAQPTMKYLLLNRGNDSDAWITWSESTTNEYGILFCARVDSSSNQLFKTPISQGPRHESVNVALSESGYFYVLFAGSDEFTWVDLLAIDDAGVKQWLLPISHPQSYSLSPTGKELVVLNDASMVAVWQDSVLKAIRVDENGNEIWGARNVTSSEVETVSASFNDADMTIIAFAWDKDIFAQNINNDGTLGAPYLFIKDTNAAPTIDGGFTSGCSWVDVNNDGFLDLFLTDRKKDNLLYIGSESGTFTKMTVTSAIYGISSSEAAAWGDFDNDGDEDLFVANSDQTNYLYENQNGTLVQIAPEAIINDGGLSQDCAWADYDNDGDLDLFVANLNANFLYANNGDKTFTKITDGAIVTDDQMSLGCAWGDYNGDGWPDLFVANVGPNSLYTNNGDGTFTKVTTGDVVTDDQYSTGGSWGDYDNDGDLDLYVTNFNDQVNALYQNNGDGTFTKVTSDAVVNDGAFSSSSAWGDYDNDGDLDLFVANAKSEKNMLFENNGDGSFSKVTRGIVTSDIANSQACAWGDYDNDGDLDLFVANAWDQNNFLYENLGTENHWVQIQCVGTTSNTSAIGARIRIKAAINGEPVWQLREISSQTGHAGQNSHIVTFGLGDATIIDSLVVQWPSGSVQTWVNAPIDQLFKITEGSDILPVELALFSAVVEDHRVKLFWRTETEESNVGFEVQRCQVSSGNSSRSWQTVAFVRGHGTSQTAHEYEFIDNQVEGAGTYSYRLKQIDADGSYHYSRPIDVVIAAPASFQLDQNYPNPFNPETTIRYTLPERGHVMLKVFDLHGREVATLVDAEKPAGAYTATWNGRDEQGRNVASGMYFYRIQFKDRVLMGKMILMR